MKKFNKSFVAGKTVVSLAGFGAGFSGYFLVKEINECRKHIKIQGVEGSFQRSHVLSFSNKK